MLATCPAILNFLDLMIVIIFGEEQIIWRSFAIDLDIMWYRPAGNW
jgi:hypothetical protein